MLMLTHQFNFIIKAFDFKTVMVLENLRSERYDFAKGIYAGLDIAQ